MSIFSGEFHSPAPEKIAAEKSPANQTPPTKSAEAVPGKGPVENPDERAKAAKSTVADKAKDQDKAPPLPVKNTGNKPGQTPEEFQAERKAAQERYLAAKENHPGHYTEAFRNAPYFDACRDSAQAAGDTTNSTCMRAVFATVFPKNHSQLETSRERVWKRIHNLPPEVRRQAAIITGLQGETKHMSSFRGWEKENGSGPKTDIRTMERVLAANSMDNRYEHQKFHPTKNPKGYTYVGDVIAQNKQYSAVGINRFWKRGTVAAFYKDSVFVDQQNFDRRFGDLVTDYNTYERNKDNLPDNQVTYRLSKGAGMKPDAFWTPGSWDSSASPVVTRFTRDDDGQLMMRSGANDVYRPVPDIQPSSPYYQTVTRQLNSGSQATIPAGRVCAGIDGRLLCQSPSNYGVHYYYEYYGTDRKGKAGVWPCRANHLGTIFGR